MTELDEVELQHPDAPLSPPPSRRRPPVWPWLAALAVLIAAALAVWWVFLRAPEPVEPAVEPPPSAEQPAPEPVAQSEPEPEVELPPLEESDAVVAQLVGRLSSNPQLVAWLANDQLARRFVAAVDNVAEGVSPRPHLRFMEPAGEFEVQEGAGGELTADPASYHRYDLATEVFVSLDEEGAARLYRQLKPLFDQAYRELGYPDRNFDRVLARAISRLLAVPVPQEPPELEPRTVTFEYADPELENLEPAEKLLLRMGPDNARRVQTKLRRLAATLDLSVGSDS
jgi:hypothetical protein